MKERIAEPRRQTADADAKLTRLYAAIESGLADLADADLKGRMWSCGRPVTQHVSRRTLQKRHRPGRHSCRRKSQPASRTRLAAACVTRTVRSGGTASKPWLSASTFPPNAVRITGSEAILSDALARSGQTHPGQTHPGLFDPASGVRTFEPKWLPEQDSNLRPFD